MFQAHLFAATGLIADANNLYYVDGTAVLNDPHIAEMNFFLGFSAMFFSGLVLSVAKTAVLIIMGLVAMSATRRRVPSRASH